MTFSSFPRNVNPLQLKRKSADFCELHNPLRHFNIPRGNLRLNSQYLRLLQKSRSIFQEICVAHSCHQIAPCFPLTHATLPVGYSALLARLLCGLAKKFQWEFEETGNRPCEYVCLREDSRIQMRDVSNRLFNELCSHSGPLLSAWLSGTWLISPRITFFVFIIEFGLFIIMSLIKAQAVRAAPQGRNYVRAVAMIQYEYNIYVETSVISHSEGVSLWTSPPSPSLLR